MIDWTRLFVPEVPLLEIFVRGSIIYLGTFVMLRVILRREFGAVSVMDLIVIVFIADAAQNGMAGDYKSVTDGLALVAVLIFWAYALDFLSFRFPAFQRLVKPRALPVIENGRLVKPNMRKEFITEEELMAELRSHGVEDLASVRRAYIESDGTFTVIKYGSDDDGDAGRKKTF